MIKAVALAKTLGSGDKSDESKKSISSFPSIPSDVMPSWEHCLLITSIVSSYIYNRGISMLSLSLSLTGGSEMYDSEAPVGLFFGQVLAIKFNE